MSVKIPRPFVSKKVGKKIVDDLTIRFPKDSDKAPIPMYLNLDGDIILPKYYGLILADEYNLPIDIRVEELGIPDEEDRLKFLIELTIDRVDQSVVIEECMQYLFDYGSVILASYTGSGKTIMACKLISNLLSKDDDSLAMIITGRTGLMDQWAESIDISLDVGYAVIGLKKSKLCRGGGLPVIFEDVRILICMEKRISKLDEATLARVKVLVIDEGHDLCTKCSIENILSINHPEHIVVCTATPVRDNGSTIFLENLTCGKIVRRYDPRHHELRCINTGVKTSSIKVNSKNDWQLVKKYLYSNTHRTNVVVEYVIANIDLNPMILVDYTKQADELKEIFESRDYGCSLIMEKVKKKDYTPKQILICTTGKCGTGFDEKSFCGRGVDVPDRQLLIITLSIKVKDRIAQWIGRNRHPEPIIGYLKDTGKAFDNHYKAVIQTLQMNKVDYTETKINARKDGDKIKFQILK